METKKAISFEKCSSADLAQGIQGSKSGAWICIHCGQVFEEGLVYPIAGGLAIAERAAKAHVEEIHGGALAALLALGPEALGLPEVQDKVLRLLAEGQSDREIALALGGKSESTVRNHRFNLRKRASEARTFLALFDLIEERRPEKEGDRLLDYPASVPTRDERTVITESEAEAVEARCLGRSPSGGPVIVFWPKKQKEKLVLLRRIAELFAQGKSYTEPEVNAILSPVFYDHVTIRRYLIEYRFLDRKADGSSYWRI